MEQFQICMAHQEKIVHIGRDVDNNKLLAKCGMCLPFLEGVPYQRVIDTLNNFENEKNVMINHFEDQKNYNVKTLRELIGQLNQFKMKQILDIEQAINYGESEILQIEKKCNISQKQIKEYNASLDIEDLKTLLNTLQNKSSLHLTQQKLLEFLIQINQQALLLESFKILEKLPYPLKIPILDQENSNSLKKVYKCPKHNKMLIGIDLNLKNQSFFVCATDAQNASLNYIQLDEAEKKWREYHNHSKPCYERLQNLVKQFVFHTISLIENQFKNTQKKLEQFLLILDKYQNSKLQKLNQMLEPIQFNQFDFSSVEKLKQLQKISKISNYNWKIFEIEVKNFHYFLGQKQIQICLRRVNELVGLILNSQIDQIKETKIQFDQVSSIKQKGICCAIAINTEGNILLAGSDEKINVFQFNSGFLNQIQQLCGHIRDVNCLQFMKNQNMFVSASDDKTIKIWKQLSVNQKNNYWSITQTLIGHTDKIFCLVISLSSDQIISGGLDKSIRFWNFNSQEWSRSQIIQDHKEAVYCLSLNELQQKLISCGEDDLILVMEQVTKNEWQIIQKIQTSYGCRLCFINDDIFSFQSHNGELQIYKLNDQQQKFTLTTSLMLHSHMNQSHFLFPQKFIKSKQILISKHNYCLNIISRDENETLLIEQCIHFDYQSHYGTISEDGEYLVTWDLGSKEIKVRQFKIFELKNYCICTNKFK